MHLQPFKQFQYYQKKIRFQSCQQKVSRKRVIDEDKYDRTPYTKFISTYIIVLSMYTYLSSGATGAYAVGYLNCDWKKFSDSIYTVGTLVLALLLLFISYNNSLWILYVIYITYGTIYQILMTITTYVTLIGGNFFFKKNVQMKNHLKLPGVPKLLDCGRYSSLVILTIEYIRFINVRRILW